jgi:hypothetical protein
LHRAAETAEVMAQSPCENPKYCFASPSKFSSLHIASEVRQAWLAWPPQSFDLSLCNIIWRTSGWCLPPARQRPAIIRPICRSIELVIIQSDSAATGHGPCRAVPSVRTACWPLPPRKGGVAGTARISSLCHPCRLSLSSSLSSLLSLCLSLCRLGLVPLSAVVSVVLSVPLSVRSLPVSLHSLHARARPTPSGETSPWSETRSA